MRARTGKIARLPLAIREELNRRLLENEPARKIMAWINPLPETISVCDEFGEQPIDDRNISDWRHGGYQDWLNRRDRLEHTRELATFAGKLARANGSSISEGAAAIASGRILELLEACEEKLEPEALGEIISGLTNLRKAEIGQARVDLGHEVLKRKDEELLLSRERFKRETCELFLKWYENQAAREVAGSTSTNAEKLERLGQLMFGDDWAPSPARGTANAPSDGATGANTARP